MNTATQEIGRRPEITATQEIGRRPEAEENVTGYEPIETVSNVLMRVPEEGSLKLEGGYAFELPTGKTTCVPVRWQDSIMVQCDPYVFVTRHFFIHREDFGTREDLGQKKICATVKVFKKTVAPGRVSFVLDIHPCPADNDHPFYDCVINVENAHKKGAPIPDHNLFLQFKQTAPPAEITG